jgi:uncharacterized membrane-anchored protein
MVFSGLSPITTTSPSSKAHQKSGSFAPPALPSFNALADFCARRGLDPLKPGAKQHRVALRGTSLRWEQHSEFTTYAWELPSETETPFHPAAASLAAPMASLPQPGPLLVALDLHLLAETANSITVERLFDRASLAVAENSDGDALFATDFQADPAGFVRITVLDRGLGPERAGALVQRIIELETYRTLALLGLPEAQRLIEQRGRDAKVVDFLAEITAHCPKKQAGNMSDQCAARCPDRPRGM